MTKVINNADDFGYSHAVNYGIVDSYLHGVLTSTTLMAGMEGFDHAVELAKKHPGLGIGVHLTLTCGKPVLNGHQTLVDEHGNFHKLSYIKDDKNIINEEEIYNEWKAQIDKIYEAGIQPTHLDSHHHVHTMRQNPSIVQRLATLYGLPVRNSFDTAQLWRSKGIKCNDILINPWIPIEQTLDNYQIEPKNLALEICRLLKEASASNDVIEIMWHPAYLDAKLLNESGFALPRLVEVQAIRDIELIKYMREHVTLCTFQDI